MPTMIINNFQYYHRNLIVKIDKNKETGLIQIYNTRSTCNNFSIAWYVAYKVREVIVMFKWNKKKQIMIAH